MKTAAQNANAPSTPNVQAIEDMLDDLDLDTIEAGDANDDVEELIEASDDAVIEGEIIEPEAVSDEELEASVDIDDLDLAIEKDSAYSSQESETKTTENAAKAVAAAKNKPQRSTSGESRASTPRVPRDLNALEAVHFVLEGDASTMDQATLDKNKADVIAAMPTQKKVAEKYENLFIAVAMGKQPSVYVKAAFKLLDEKKTVTSSDIVGMLKGSYSQGTAQSQAGQIMTLFAATKIADRQKNTLTLNENSVVAQKLRDIYANAGAGA